MEKRKPVLAIDMLEWQQRTPEGDEVLSGLSLSSDRRVQELARQLTQLQILEIVELRNGLSIRSTSFVGRIWLGDLQITVRPKLRHDVLLSLFRYAYNLRDLRLLTQTEHGTLVDAFQDLLIQQLVAEVSELIARGLQREYVQVNELLEAPRGRIDMQQLARRGGLREAAVPSTHYPRLEDRLVNQVVMAGLRLAVSLTDDLLLRTRLRRLAALMGETVTRIPLTSDVLCELDRQMNRLTAAYEPALTLIRMLLRSAGISLEQDEAVIPLPGFLFDMNQFFETLMSRFLRENLLGYVVHDQYRLRGMMTYAPEHNPRRRQDPTPRPDYVVTRNGIPVAMLDAKYRDIWANELPRDMLYQLAIYALSQGADGCATILYPTTDIAARPEVIEIREVRFGHYQGKVIMHPVNLNDLDRLITTVGVQAERERTAYAHQLTFGTAAGGTV